MLKLLRSLTVFMALFATLAFADDSTSKLSDAKTTDDIHALITILENETARNALIERLRESAGVASGKKAESNTAAVEKLAFSRRIAQMTQKLTQGAMERAATISTQLKHLPERVRNLDGREVAVIWDVLKNLTVIIVVTFGLYILLRRYSKYIYRRLSEKAKTARFIRRLNLWIYGGAADAATVIAASAVGYGVAVGGTGEVGQIGIHQTMFLNAFFLVGMFKVVARLFIAPHAPRLRPLPVTDHEAQYLAYRINWIASVTGYGQLLLVPVINTNVSYSSGQLTSILIALSVLVYLIWISISNRVSVARWLAGDQRVVGSAGTNTKNMSESIDEEPRQGFLSRLASYWYVPVIIYLAVMFTIVIVSPPGVVFKTFISSGQLVLVIMFGITLSRFLSHVAENEIPVPGTVATRVPTLQAHLNRFMPVFLAMIQYLIVILAVLLILETVGAIDLPVLISSPIGLKFLSVVMAVTTVLLVSFLIWIVLNSWVDYRLNPSVGKVASARETTLLTLFRNAATSALLIITLMFVLSEIGLDIAPLLASAGVLGLAIGFGAQKLVQDIITGIFIQIENAMNVGDYVTLGNLTGKVEKLTTRSVSIRDKYGAFHILPFSSVDMVTSYARDFCYFLCDMGVGYSENADTVKQAMSDAYKELMTDPVNAEKILGDLEWYGLQSFGDSALVFRIKIKCRPGTHWSVGRAYNGILKKIFDERNIEIPFPHQTIYFGDSGDKESGAAKLAGIDKA